MDNAELILKLLKLLPNEDNEQNPQSDSECEMNPITGTVLRSVVYPGAKVLIRTVTSYFAGVVSEVDDHFIALAHASWVADTGRFSDALKSGSFTEVEMYDRAVIVAVAAVVDVTTLPEVPAKQK